MHTQAEPFSLFSRQTQDLPPPSFLESRSTTNQHSNRQRGGGGGGGKYEFNYNIKCLILPSSKKTY